VSNLSLIFLDSEREGERIIGLQSDKLTTDCREKHMSIPNHTTPVLALLCAACLLPLLPAVAQAQEPSTRTDYWIDDTDSSLAETVVDDTCPAIPPDSGDWSSITLAEIHALCRYSPSEDEAVAQIQGNWQQNDATLGKNTIETAWFRETFCYPKRWITGGSTSTRVKGKVGPGYVYSEAHLYSSGPHSDQWAQGNKYFVYSLSVATRPDTVYWGQGPFTFWDFTYHSYGSGNYVDGPDIHVEF